MELLSSKTFWTGVLGMATAAGGFYTGNMDAAQAGTLAFTALQTIFLRHAVAKAS